DPPPLCDRSTPCPLLLFITLRPQPPPPLFPYTTLFRSSALRNCAAASSAPPDFRTRNWLVPQPRRSRAQPPSQFLVRKSGGALRSEEHTSELQSLAYLVCRLLLEKKKKQKNACRSNACL